ncbi:MAG: amino acid ABC transporter permease [Desulfurococcaceae archaeon]
MDFVEEILYLTSNYGPDLLNAMLLTIEITFIGFSIGLLLGLPISLGRVYGPLPLKVILATYIEFIRGTPMIVQLFFIYYALPIMGITLDAFTASIIAIGLNSAAYQAEYFRMAFGAIQREQWEAALSIGLSRLTVLTSVVLPQGMRIAIPALTNEIIYLLKYSSIAYFVTVPELVYVSKIIGARTLLHIQIYTVTAVFYISMSIILTKFAKIIEEKTAIPGLVLKGRT